MTKWQCTRCDVYDPCFYESGKTCTEPIPDWEPIRSENWGKPQIPDWIKVVAWVYDKEECSYGVVLSINMPRIVVEYADTDIVNTVNEIVPARVRPYNKDEMKRLVRKVITFEENRDLVISYDAKSGKVFIGDVWLSGENLLNNGYATCLGEPLGTLEHLNEGGEWVE